MEQWPPQSQWGGPRPRSHLLLGQRAGRCPPQSQGEVTYSTKRKERCPQWSKQAQQWPRVIKFMVQSEKEMIGKCNSALIFTLNVTWLCEHSINSHVTTDLTSKDDLKLIALQQKRKYENFLLSFTACFKSLNSIMVFKNVLSSPIFINTFCCPCQRALSTPCTLIGYLHSFCRQGVEKLNLIHQTWKHSLSDKTITTTNRAVCVNILL